MKLRLRMSSAYQLKLRVNKNSRRK